MTRRQTSIAVLLLVATSAVVAGAVRAPLPDSATSLETASVLDTRALAAQRMPVDTLQTARSIRFYADRARADPESAINRSILAGLYLQRCRETGDIADAQRAELTARESLGIRSRRNTAAYNMLALSLFAQHRFPEAASVARAVFASMPEDPQAVSTLAEIETESGDMKKASSHLVSLRKLSPDSPYTAALAARVDELRGLLPEAQKLLEIAARKADRSTDLPRENVAWFHFRAGNIRAMRGDASGAHTAYADALAWYPQDYKTMLALAKLDAGMGRWTDAITYACQSADVVPMPETIGLLQDCYAATGDRANANASRELWEAMRRLSRAEGAIYDRQRAMYCADHGVHLNEALGLARHELSIRKDVYAYDTFGWVSFNCGHFQDALTALNTAIATGAQDSLLYFHRGEIEAALHRNDAARQDLTRALALNPYFHPTGPGVARATLARLGSGKLPEAS